jgi:hypothetical protein
MGGRAAGGGGRRYSSLDKPPECVDGPPDQRRVTAALVGCIIRDAGSAAPVAGETVRASCYAST